MVLSDGTEIGKSMRSNSADYNNTGICAVALMGLFGVSKTLPVSKALLVMPLIMHEGTVKHLSDGRTARREITALISARPDLFSNFPARFSDSLATSLNAIQLLTQANFIELGKVLRVLRELHVDSSFGKRAAKVHLASKNISAILDSPADELYLNLRIPL